MKVLYKLSYCKEMEKQKRAERTFLVFLSRSVCDYVAVHVLRHGFGRMGSWFGD